MAVFSRIPLVLLVASISDQADDPCNYQNGQDEASRTSQDAIALCHCLQSPGLIRWRVSVDVAVLPLIVAGQRIVGIYVVIVVVAEESQRIEIADRCSSHCREMYVEPIGITRGDALKARTPDGVSKTGPD